MSHTVHPHRTFCQTLRRVVSRLQHKMEVWDLQLLGVSVSTSPAPLVMARSRRRRRSGRTRTRGRSWTPRVWTTAMQKHVLSRFCQKINQIFSFPKNWMSKKSSWKSVISRSHHTLQSKINIYSKVITQLPRVKSRQKCKWWSAFQHGIPFRHWVCLPTAVPTWVFKNR
jgi:hypothetical protein